jgi:hypothetical protein
MNGLFHAHSGLRFLILLLGVINVGVLGLALAQKKPFEKLHRILGASYAGLLHTQVLLGLGVLMTRGYYPALIGHIVMMVLAAVVAQAAMTINRKRPVPGVQLPLIGVAVSLVCIFGGVMAISRGLFTMTPA